MHPHARRFVGLALAAAISIGSVQLSSMSPASAAAVTRVNFQPPSAATPTGFTTDAGQAFSTARGFGWVDQTTGAPKAVTLGVVDRNSTSDQRLDTLAHMQKLFTQSATTVTESYDPSMWEHALPAGTYDVTVAAGDPSSTFGVHHVNVEGVPAIKSFTPTSSNRHATAQVRVNVNDGRLTLDAKGGTNTKLNYVTITPVTPTTTTTTTTAPAATPTPTTPPAPAPTPSTTVPAVQSPVASRLNFQPPSAATPTGFITDAGQAFSTARGFGWVDQTTGAPKAVTLGVVDRNSTSDQRLDTLAHMQKLFTQSATTVTESYDPSMWEHALPAGTYDVTVAAGDPSSTFGVHHVNVEGVPAIKSFTPTSSNRHATAQVRVNVNDGRLTLDAKGGTNTKLNYVTITPVTPTTTTTTTTAPAATPTPTTSTTVVVTAPTPPPAPAPSRPDLGVMPFAGPGTVGHLADLPGFNIPATQLVPHGGNLTTSHDGQVIEERDVSGAIIIRHKNVIVRRNRVGLGVWALPTATHPDTSGRVEWNTIGPRHGSESTFVAGNGRGENLTFYRNELFGGVDLFNFYYSGNIVLEENWAHSPYQMLSDPYQQDTSTRLSHNDGVQVHKGGSKYHFIRNRFDLFLFRGYTWSGTPHSSPQTAIAPTPAAGSQIGVFPNIRPMTTGFLLQQTNGRLSDIVFDGNIIDGDYYRAISLPKNSYSESATNVRIINNTFVRRYPTFGASGFIGVDTPSNVTFGNNKDHNGTQIPRPTGMVAP